MNDVTGNEALMIELVEAFGRGDIPHLQALIAEGAVWHVPGKSRLAGTYTGHGEIFGFFG